MFLACHVISDVFANVFLSVDSNKISVTSISLQVVFLNKMVTEYTIPVQCMDPMETYSLHTGRYIIIMYNKYLKRLSLEVLFYTGDFLHDVGLAILAKITS